MTAGRDLDAGNPRFRSSPLPGAWSLQNKHNPWDPPPSLFLPCVVPQMLPQSQPIPSPAPEDLEEGGVYSSPSLWTLLSLSSIPWEGTEGAILERAPEGLCESFLPGNSTPWGSLRGCGWQMEPQMEVRALDGPGHRMVLPCLKDPLPQLTCLLGHSQKPLFLSPCFKSC